MGTDLLLVRYLDAPLSVSQLSDQSGRDKSRVSRVVHRLEQQGFVSLERDGKSLIVRRTGTTAALLVQLLDAYPHHPWDQLLTKPHLEMVSFFSSPLEPGLSESDFAAIAKRRPPFVLKTAADAVAWTGYSPTHVHRTLSSLRRHNLLLRRGPNHYLAPEHRMLKEFADQYHRSWALRTIAEIHPLARLLWNLGRVVLYDTPELLDDNTLGGTSLSADHGISLITPRSTHLIAPWQPTASDAILQIFLEAPNRTSNIAYSCLLWEKNRPSDFERRARQYGVPHAANAIKAYEQNPEQGRPPFPSSRDYRELARQYGVT